MIFLRDRGFSSGPFVVPFGVSLVGSSRRLLRGAGSIPAGVFLGLVWLLRGLSACPLTIPYRSIIKRVRASWVAAD